MERKLDRLSYRTLQWLVVAFALLHNLEEALTIPAYAPQVRRRLAGIAPAPVLAVADDLSWLRFALLGATVAPAIVVLVATTTRPSRGNAWAVVFVQSLFLGNVLLPHVPAALFLGGYAPGLATAVLINLPYSVYFLRRSVRERILSRRDVALAIGLAFPALLVGLGVLYMVIADLH